MGPSNPVGNPYLYDIPVNLRVCYGIPLQEAEVRWERDVSPSKVWLTTSCYPFVDSQHEGGILIAVVLCACMGEAGGLFHC